MKLIKFTLVTLVYLFELPSISSDCGLTEPLGVEDGTIPSDNLIASSAYKNYTAQHGRLNTASGWIPENLNQLQWIQADLDDVKSVIGLVTQGLSDGPLWVTSYKAIWHNNDSTFYVILNENGTEILKGNTDQNTKVTQMFQSTIYTQFIRICPMEWHIYIALRFELLGPLPGSYALGVEDGTAKLTASSEHSAGYVAEEGRLNAAAGNRAGTWKPIENNQAQWIEANLGDVKSVIGVVTQGSPKFSEWVTSYKVSWSDNGSNFTFVENVNGTEIFSGNTDQNTEVTQMFKSAIDAQFIRISPFTWNYKISLRIEILGPCQDNEVPNLICPHDTSETTDPGKSNSSATWNDPTVTDNVDSNLTVTCSSASGSSFDAGSTIVNCSATDNAGNTDSCTFNVTIKDIEVPKVICPDDINQATDQGQSTSSATWNDPEVTDNVDSSLSVTCSPISGLSFSVGSTPVICSAKDTAGNTGSCTFNVTVKDEEIPNVICPSDISKFIIEGQSTSTATWREPMVIDNFDFSLSANCSHASGASFSVGSTTVNCSVEDSAGNTGSCTFNVEVIDIDIPSVTCPDDISQTTIQGQSASAATWNEPIVIDNVDSSLSANCSRASGSYFRVGTTAVTCSATDTAGKTGSCTFNVEVKDTEVPNVTCHDDMSQATDQGQSTSSATWNDPTVTDNVDSSLSVTCSPVSGLPFSVGSTPVICSARDTAGNTGSCTFNVIVKDEDIPDVICPSDISKFTVEGQSTSLAAWHEPTVIDNVDVSLSATCSRANGSSFSVGFTTVKCSAEDTAGNTGSCSFNVEVIDIEIPTVTCPNYVRQTAVQGQSTLSATWNEPIVTDNVDSSLSANCSRASGSYFRVGTTAVTCSATDTAGNTGGCTFNVEVEAVKQIIGRFTIVKIGPDIATFTADYDDPTSNAYQELALMILQALTAIFGSAPGFVDIQILNLDPGSIIVDYYVELKSTGAAASDLDLLFVQNVNSEGKLNGSMLDLNPESIQKFYEICPEDYCNNGGTCSMDMNNFKSSCTCTEGYIGETCQLVIWSIIVGSLGVVFLLISLICCCYVGHSGRQLNLMYQQGMISKRPKYLEDNVYDKINLSPRFVHTYNDNNVTQGKFDGSLKENGHFSRPYIVSGN